MTPKEFVARLLERFPTFDPKEVRLMVRIVFDFQAQRLYEARLAAGGKICDVSDVKQLLYDWTAAAANESTDSSPAKLIPRKIMCMKCFHVHEKGDVCGVNLGKGGECDCTAEVRA